MRVVAPPLRKGDIVMYDYRCMHRGGANTSGRARPLAYVTFSPREGADTWNFPNRSVFADAEEM